MMQDSEASKEPGEADSGAEQDRVAEEQEQEPRQESEDEQTRKSKRCPSGMWLNSAACY